MLEEGDVQVWRSVVPYPENNTRGFQKVIDEVVQFAMWLSCVVTMQKDDHGQRLWIPPIGVSDDEPNYVAERLLSRLIARRCTSLERNGLERFG